MTSQKNECFRVFFLKVDPIWGRRLVALVYRKNDANCAEVKSSSCADYLTFYFRPKPVSLGSRLHFYTVTGRPRWVSKLRSYSFTNKNKRLKIKINKILIVLSKILFLFFSIRIICEFIIQNLKELFLLYFFM